MKRPLQTLTPALLIAAPITLAIWYLARFAVDVPVADEWHLAEDLHALAQGEEGLTDLWRLHNEHRMLFPRAALLALAWLSGWNTITEMYASFGLLLLILLFWWHLFRRIHPTGLWPFVPLAWLICALGQWENMLTGWQLQFYLGTLALLWAAERLARGSVRSLCAAGACGVVASFSFSNGLVIWPAGLIGLALMRAGRMRLGVWGGLAALVTAVYYYGYEPGPGHPSPTAAFAYPVETLAFLLVNIGSPLGGGSVRVAGVMGTFLLALVIIRLLPDVRRLRSLPGPETTLNTLLVAALGSSLAIAIGRVGFHQPGWATSSRYVTMASIAPAVLYLMLVKRNVPRVDSRGEMGVSAETHLAPMLLVLMLIGVALSVGWGLDEGPNVYAARQKFKLATQTFTQQPDEAFDSEVSAELIRQYGPFLQARRWSVFRYPVAMLALSSYEGGLPVGEIVADQPLIQHVTCPVSTLKDFQLLFGTYGRRNTSMVNVTLAEGSQVLAERSFSASGLEDNRWLTINVAPQVERCAGRDLTITISSPDATLGNAVTIWSYPRYYPGALLRSAEPLDAEQVLGLSLNMASERALR